MGEFLGFLARVAEFALFVWLVVKVSQASDAVVRIDRRMQEDRYREIRRDKEPQQTPM